MLAYGLIKPSVTEFKLLFFELELTLAFASGNGSYRICRNCDFTLFGFRYFMNFHFHLLIYSGQYLLNEVS
jgi:hypothetical protein